MTERLFADLRASPRLRALQLLWRASRSHCIAAAVFIVAEGVLPVLVLLLMGRVVVAIPAAVLHGLSSPAGHRLIANLAAAGGAYAASLLRGPAEDALTGADSARELRTYGLTEALIERHDALVDRVRRRSVRAALLSALLEGVGWLVFALGVVGAIVVLLRGALARADASAIEQSLPEGLLTRVGTGFTGGRDLSGGQWQRLALARGLMREAPLLVVLDEPTASLDAATENALFDRYTEAARRLGEAQGTITVLVPRRFSTVRGADLIVVLDQGRVAERGTHAQLMAAGGTYAELFKLQASGYA